MNEAIGENNPDLKINFFGLHAMVEYALFYNVFDLCLE